MRAAQLPKLTANEQRAATKASRERNDGRPLLTADEAGEYLKRSKWTIYRLIKSGELRSIQVESALRIRPSDLDAYLDANVVS